MAGEKRNQLVIEPTIQYSLVRQLAVHWTLHLVTTVLVLCMLQFLLGGLFRPWQYHVERLWPTLATLVVSLVLLLPVFIQSSLKLSNRFAGPIHRLRREFRSLANGKPYRELKFRVGDYWLELSSEFDDAVAALQEQIADEDPNSRSQAAEPERSVAGVIFPSGTTSTDAGEPEPTS